MLSVISSQAWGQPEVTFGVKLGVNVSSLKYEAPPDFGIASLTRYHAGIFGRVRWNKIALQPELLYSREGGVLKPIQGQSNTAMLEYVSFPVVVKWYVLNRLNVQAGPHIGFTTNRSMKLDPPISGVGTSDLTTSIHNMNYGAIIGLGLELPIGLSFDLRYCYGLMNISKIDPDKAHLEVLQFAAGYRIFKFGK